MDFVLIMIAVSVALVCKRVIVAFQADEARRRRKIGALPLVRIGEAPAGARVKIAGAVERVGARGTLTVRDGSGAAARVYGGSAAAVLGDRGAGAGARAVTAFAEGDAVIVVGVGRAPEPAFDRDLGDERLVFAGSEAQPMFLVVAKNLEAAG